MKKLLATMLVLVMVLCVTACNEEPPFESENSTQSANNTTTNPPTTTHPITTETPVESGGISHEFKKAMTEYEEFFDEYIEFMREYKSSTNPLPMMDDYVDYLNEYAEAMEALNEINEDELTIEEALYYTEVMSRISKKILEIDTNTSTSEEPTLSHDIDDLFDELENNISAETEELLESLYKDYESLITEIDTFDKYLSNESKIETFYNNIYDSHYDLCKKMYFYSLDYAKIILNSNKSLDDKYDYFDEIYDVIYDDIGDELYDEIYNGILDEIYDEFYNGILKDAYDTVPYSDWSSARSNEYDLWSDTRSDVYDDWSDTRSDIYDFWSDIRSKLWKDDIEGAKKILQDFEDDVKKLN